MDCRPLITKQHTSLVENVEGSHKNLKSLQKYSPPSLMLMHQMIKMMVPLELVKNKIPQYVVKTINGIDSIKWCSNQFIEVLA